MNTDVVFITMVSCLRSGLKNIENGVSCLHNYTAVSPSTVIPKSINLKFLDRTMTYDNYAVRSNQDHGSSLQRHLNYAS